MVKKFKTSSSSYSHQPSSSMKTVGALRNEISINTLKIQLQFFKHMCDISNHVDATTFRKMFPSTCFEDVDLYTSHVLSDVLDNAHSVTRTFFFFEKYSELHKYMVEFMSTQTGKLPKYMGILYRIELNVRAYIQQVYVWDGGIVGSHIRSANSMNVKHDIKKVKINQNMKQMFK